jgi:tetratricopeptide (TPR) repeat protein
LKAYEAKWFDFIVSLSARDRALTNTGIVATKPTLSSLEDLIRQICETTGFTEYNNLPLEERIQRVRMNILGEFRGLLFVDNLETISDPTLVRFLEDLPMPTKAIVTSRKVKIRVANFPVDIGPFEEREAISFLNETARSNRKQFLAEMAAAEKKIIVDGCDCIPLIIEWLVGRARDPQKAIRLAKSLTKDGGHGEELLEFAFRRVYAEMTGEQHAVLQVLALTSRPLPIEAIAIGSSLSPHKAADVLEELKDYSLLEKIYDTSYRDIVYSLLPVTGSFIMRELSKQSKTELKIRKLLTDWYQAEDVVDGSDRQLMQQVRRGERDPELALLEVARHLIEQNELNKAESFFKQSIDRNPRSWQCHLELAEFYKSRGMIGESLKHFERAAEFSPKQGPDRASIFGEWGLLIKASGNRTALRDAAPKLAEALKETPTDHICRNALGECYVHIGSIDAAIHILEPLRNVVRLRSDLRKSMLRLLEQCYKATSDIIKLAEVRNEQRDIQ